MKNTIITSSTMLSTLVPTKAASVALIIAALGLSSAHASTLVITDLGVNTGGTIVSSTSTGTLTTLGGVLLTPANSPTLGGVTFNLELAGAPINGVSSTVTFDLTATTGPSDGVARNGSFFIVDTGNDGSGAATDAGRIDSSELLQFSISNAFINGSAASLSNVVFSNASFVNTATGSLGGSIAADGLVTVFAGENVRLDDFDLSFDVAVPEPSSTALFGLGGIALLARRKR